METLIVLWIIWTGMVEIKHRLYRCCSYYALKKNNGLRIYGEGRTQIPLSLPAMIGPLARIQDRQGLYWSWSLLDIGGMGAFFRANFLKKGHFVCLHQSYSKWGYQGNLIPLYLFIYLFIYFLQEDFTHKKHKKTENYKKHKKHKKHKKRKKHKKHKNHKTPNKQLSSS